MTKDEALAKIDELRAYVQQEERGERSPRIAERFTTATCKTGVILHIPALRDLTKDERRMPIIEFLIRRFIALGGVVCDAEVRIKVWKTARFTQIWEDGDADDVYETLATQPLTEDVAGETYVYYMDTAQEIETNGGKSFNDLLEDGIEFVDPMAFLALLLSLKDPSDISSYPSRGMFRWEWVAGLVKQNGSTYALRGARARLGSTSAGMIPSTRVPTTARVRSSAHSWVDLVSALGLAGPHHNLIRNHNPQPCPSYNLSRIT